MKRTMPVILLLAAAVSLSVAQEIKVPDLETRITNTGNAIPESALPAVKAPAIAPLPEAVPAVTAVPVAVDVFVVPAMDPAVAPASATEITSFNQPSVTGWLELGAGGPGSLFGDISLSRDSGSIPGFSTDFRYDSADGYGRDKAGTGFFDRSTRLAASLFSDTADSSWNVSFGLLDRTDGFQGKSAMNTGPSFGLSRRDISWNAELKSKTFLAEGFSGTLGFAGTLFSAAAAPLDGHDGYLMTPRASIGFEYGAFNAEAHGFYGYETAAGDGEYHSGVFGIDFRYAFRALVMEAGVSAFGDSEDGFLVPFRLAVAFDRNESFLRNLFVAGGLSAERNSPLLLSTEEPFAALDGLSVHAADWMASGGFSVAPADALSVSAEAVYRKTAFGRGTLVLLDERLATGLIQVVREERDSLVMKAVVVMTAPGSELSAGYEGEWLDRLHRKNVHSVEAGFRLFDTTDKRLWEAGIRSAFALDSVELPRLSLKGTVSPVANFALNLSFTDVLPFLFDKDRTRNGLYAERSGELVFSARLDF